MKKLIALLLSVAMVMSLCVFTASADDVTEISLWTYPIGNWGDSATVDELIAQFNEVYPNIKVTVEYLTYTDGDDKVNTAIEGNAAPDIVMEGGQRLVSNWGAKGLMVDLSDLWTDEVKADVYDSVEVMCHNDEGIYYMYPLCMNAHCMAINKTIFEETGAIQYIDEETHTWTTENFLKAVQCLYDAGYENVAAVYCSGQGGDQGTRALYNNLYGGTFTNAEHTAYTMDSEENIKALQTLYDQAGINFDASINGGEEADLFAQGVLCMAFCWNAGLHAARTDVIGDSFEVFPMAFPSPEGTDVQLCGGAWGFGVFDNGDDAKIEAAKTFIQWMCNENTTNAVAASTYWPVVESAEDPYADDEVKSVYKMFTQYLGDYYEGTPGWTEVRTAAWNMLQAIGSGTAVEEAVATFMESANAAVAAAS